MDADEFVARVIAQVPDPRRHLIRHHGWYSNAARAKRVRQGSDEPKKKGASGSGLPLGATTVPAPTDADANAARRRWVNLIRHVYIGNDLANGSNRGPLTGPEWGGVVWRGDWRGLLALQEGAGSGRSPASRRQAEKSGRKSG